MKRAISILVVAILAGAAPTPLAQQKDLGVASKDGVVVCTSAPACDAGASVLAKGGNAVDAAVATAFALAVTHPAAGNIGGGGFMIVRTPDGKAASFDFRERAPLAATRTMYLDEKGQIVRSLTNAGYLAPGVPGSVRGLALAHSRFGKLPWKDVVMPGVLLAEEGFIMSAALARSLNREVLGTRDTEGRQDPGPMAKFPASVEAYGKPGGGEWQAGDRIVLRDLGKTLRAIATDGPDAFYTGWIADAIAADMKANGGLITKEDLAKYEAKERTPVRGTYKDFEIISMPPVSSGGVALIEMLNILEPMDLKTRGLLTSEALHLQIEAMRRAYLDRARHLGDPDFVTVPVEMLTSKAHARQVAASIDPAKASSSIELGKDIVTVTTQQEADQTTHYSVIDKDGMAVATTTTLEGSYGSHVVVKGAGFLLNNEMGDFNKKPGETNVGGDIGTPANLIDPGKRMLSSMTPTIVSRDGKLVLVTGSPGGRTIINTVFTIVFGVVEYGLSGREAVDLPRMHHQWLPDRVTFEETSAPAAEVIEKLKAMGHSVRIDGRQGDAHTIWVAPDGTVYGVNEKRTPDGKASVPVLTSAATNR